MQVLAPVIPRLRRGQRGITGLETAIIVLAFIVVASVFSYTILSAGIFATGQSREAILSGLAVARSAVVISGPVIAKNTDGDSDVDEIQFILVNAGDGEGIDFRATTDTDNDGLVSDETNRVHTTAISYADSRQRIEDLAWTKIALGRGDGDDMLEQRERFQITIYLTTALTSSLTAYGAFTIEVRPGGGSSLVIERAIPAQVDAVMDLR